MLKKSMFAVLAMALLAPAAASAQDSKPTSKPASKPATPQTEPAKPEVKDDKAYSLVYKFTKGAERTYLVRAAQKMETQNFEIKAAQVLVEKVESFDADKKVGTVLLEPKTLKLSTTMGDRTQEYDSEKKDPGQAPMGDAMLKAMKAKSTLKVHADGSTKRREIDGQGPQQDVFKSPIFAIQDIPFDFARMPKKAVKAGDTWTVVLERAMKEGDKGTLTFKSTFTYTLKRVKNRDGQDIATIQVTSKTELNKTGDVKDSAEIKEGNGKGTIIFNITEGHLKSVNFSVKLIVAERGRDMALKYTFGARHKKPDAGEEKK
ncbi:MAG: DUF6263 family protein [Planctomycetota bacterium]|nr:DUF6263 family protein [Planctomycetota bacterium]